jgi:hypothetical protein
MFSALAVGVRRFPALIFMSLLVGLVVGVGTLFLLVPGLYLALRLSLAACVLVVEGGGPVQALHVSYKLTRQHGRAMLGTIAVILPFSVAAWGVGLAGFGFLSGKVGKFVDAGTLVGVLVLMSFAALSLALLQRARARLDPHHPA